MRRMVVAVPIAALTLLGWSALPVAAQDTKTAQGTVTAVAGNTVSVKAGAAELRFVVDQATTITAAGASTATREAAKAGRSGPTVAELIKVGQNVEVVYRESGGTLHAERIRRVASVGRGSTGDDEEQTSTGIVQAVTATSLTLTGSSGGGAKFTQTLEVDTTTKVVAVGASTAAAAGAKTITDFVGPGDRVTVWYSKKGDKIVASELRVRSKAK